MANGFPVKTTFQAGDALGASELNALGTAINQSGAGVATTAGDLLYASAANTLARLATGTANNGKVVKVAGGVPTIAAAIGIYTATQTSLYAITTSWANITGMTVSVTTPYDGARVVMFAAGKIAKGTSWAGLQGVINSVADADPIYTYTATGEAYSYLHTATIATAGTFNVSLQAKIDGGSGNCEHGRMIVMVI